MWAEQETKDRIIKELSYYTKEDDDYILEAVANALATFKDPEI